MPTLFAIFVFIFGLIVGSFLNAVIYRLKHNQSLWGFSACPHCHHRLNAADLVPLFSFVFLQGVCRYCGKKISWQYPLVESATAVVFLLAASQFSASVVMTSGLEASKLFFQLAICALLILVFVFDYRYYLIPDSAVLIGTVLAFFYGLFFTENSIWMTLGGAAFVCGFFGFLYLISAGRWIGLGDVKLGFFLGMLLGFSFSLMMLMLAYVSGAFIGVLLVLLRRKSMKGELPFGTFLTAASLVVLLWGAPLLNWYLNNFYF